MKWTLIPVGLICGAVAVHAWLRPHYSDEQIVARAELIVIGRVRDGSIVFLPRKVSEGWEHHAELLISEVLKGHAPSNAMVVSIHYGLQPVVKGWGTVTDGRVGITNYPKGVVEVTDWGNSVRPGWPTPGDIRTNHIWLLRRVQKAINFDSDWIGVYDPEDIQPVERREQLLRYLK